MNDFLMHIGNLIKNKRLMLGMTQKELEERSGVTQSMISKLEGGSADNVSIETLRCLAKSLNCAVIDLLPEQDKKPL